MTNINWQRRFIRMAQHIAMDWSKDPSTKVGCVLVQPSTNAVIATGVNGFPRIVDEAPGRWQRPTKYLFVEHAERNAIYNAARHGHATEGCHAYLNWNPVASICADCARAFIQAGVVAVYGPPTKLVAYAGGDWLESAQVGRAMVREAGLEIGVIYG